MKRFFIGAPLVLFMLTAFVFGAAPSADDAFELGRRFCDDSKSFSDLDLTNGSFSAAIRAKISGPGKEKGNNGADGMLLCAGNGWDEGFRVTYTWSSGEYFFQIGRVGGCVTAPSKPNRTIGVMRDVVATYDAKTQKMVLYVDGVKGAERDFDGKVDLKEGRLKLNVGFGRAGVGSCDMFVDKVEYWTRALSEDEVAARENARDASERLAVAAFENVASIEVGSREFTLDDIRAALALDLPPRTRDKILDVAIVSFCKEKKYEEAASYFFEEADSFLAQNDDELTEKDRLQRATTLYFQGTRIYPHLKELINGDELERRFNDVKDRAFAKYPKEKETIGKILRLNAEADAMRAMETDALETFQKTRASLDDPASIVIEVATNGSDEKGDGSPQKPYASLARAYERVQELAKTNGDAKFVVSVGEGVYRVDRIARLNEVSNVLTIGRGEAILTGGRELDGFRAASKLASKDKRVADAVERLRPEVRQHVFVVDLKEAGVEDIGRLGVRGYGEFKPIPSLYIDGESQTLARYPNEGEENLPFGERAEDVARFPNCGTFKYDNDRVQNWRLTDDGENDDIWAYGLYQYEWAGNLRRVLAIDRDKKTVTFDHNSCSGKFGYYFVNVFEELDAPGEYYVDRNSGLLYLYPPQGLESEKALREARVEYDEFEERFIAFYKTTDAVVEGLTLRAGRGLAVGFNQCDRVYFNKGTIEQIGGDAIDIREGGHCGLLNSRLRELGRCGARIKGGDRKTLARCSHLMHNNYVSDFSRIERVYAPALAFDGVGCVATNNLFCDSPHHAMRTDGNDIYIARNEVHSVVYEYSDQAGIDIYCDPSFRGIVIEDNLWRHIGSAFALCGQAGIRLDDSISGVVMRGNIFYRSSCGMFGGIQIHGGKDNLCLDNTFVDCKYGFSFSYWGGDRYERFVKGQFSENVGAPNYLESYAFFDEIFDHYDRNYVIANRVIGGESFVRNPDNRNVYSCNVSEKAPKDVQADVSLLDDPQGMRKWIEKASGRSLKSIGLKENWNGANEPVSKKYFDR